MTSPIAAIVFLLMAALVTGVGYPAPASAQTARPKSEDAPFWIENDAAMTKMMKAMAADPTGNVDRDFVAMMVPHHQGAVDMAQAFLRYGHNEQLKRLAQEIIVTQQQEIAAMRLALGRVSPVPTPGQLPATASPQPTHTHRGP